MLPNIEEDSTLARLFRQRDVRTSARWFSLPGGQRLYTAGDAADQLFFVTAGRLGAFRRDEGQPVQFLGVIRPGEPAGEMALVAGSSHSADVVALRDSEIVSLPRDAFFDACEADAAVMTELARLMILRTRQAVHQGGMGEPSVFGFTQAGDTGPLRPLIENLAQEVAALGYSATCIGVEAAGAPTEWFSNVERAHDFVLYVADDANAGWTHAVSRQVDRLFRIGCGDLAPPNPERIGPDAPLQAQQLVDLILLHPPDAIRPRGTDAWLSAAQPARLFHVRLGASEDLRRLARVLTGQSVGLVLSGGGARAYAHVGAVKALRERGVPIDFVCGVSMGAIIGAGVAMGWDDRQMDLRIRAAFVESSPLDDIALPLLAMTRGEKVSERLREHFGETQIADLWLPFFCLSSNLTTGAYHQHRRGLLRKALRASVSLPGVMPPATDGTNVLVDGAVFKNFPADVMRAGHIGPIVGIDVTASRSITAEDVARPSSVWRWIRSGEWRKGPPIVSLLMRAATVSTGRDLAAAREAADLLIQPDVSAVEIRDFAAYAPAVEAGYRATIASLDALERPVQALRRRNSLDEEAALRRNPPAKT